MVAPPPGLYDIPDPAVHHATAMVR